MPPDVKFRRSQGSYERERERAIEKAEEKRVLQQEERRRSQQRDFVASFAGVIACGCVQQSINFRCPDCQARVLVGPRFPAFPIAGDEGGQLMVTTFKDGRPINPPGSALYLYRLKTRRPSFNACARPDCNLKGRFEIRILGMPIPSGGVMGGTEVLCRKHAEEARRIWDELSGSEAPAEVAA